MGIGDNFPLKKEFRDRTFILVLISGIMLASAITYYLIGLSSHQEQILQKVDLIEKKVDTKNVTIIIPTASNNSLTGKISGIEKPIIIQ